MREVTLDELKTLTENARESLWDIAKPYGRDPKIYLHWSAGHYGQFYDDYHVNIDSDGSYHRPHLPQELWSHWVVYGCLCVQ